MTLRQRFEILATSLNVARDGLPLLHLLGSRHSCNKSRKQRPFSKPGLKQNYLKPDKVFQKRLHGVSWLGTLLDDWTGFPSHLQMKKTLSPFGCWPTFESLHRLLLHFAHSNHTCIMSIMSISITARGSHQYFKNMWIQKLSSGI